MSDAEAACAKLDEFGPAGDLISAMDAAYDILAGRATSATDASSDAEADYNAILDIFDALPEEPVAEDPRPAAFGDWVEWFTIPTKTGSCRIEATVDRADPE